MDCAFRLRIRRLRIRISAWLNVVVVHLHWRTWPELEDAGIDDFVPRLDSADDTHEIATSRPETNDLLLDGLPGFPSAPGRPSPHTPSLRMERS